MRIRGTHIYQQCEHPCVHSQHEADTENTQAKPEDERPLVTHPPTNESDDGAPEEAEEGQGERFCNGESTVFM